MSATFGPTSPRQFAFYDPNESCWRTWPAISLWGSEMYCGTWPKRGSMRNGACFEHPTWAPATSEPDSSSLLPTPIKSDEGEGEDPKTRALRGYGPHLRDVAWLLLPTPVVNDMGEGKTPERWDEWTAEMQERHANGNGHGRSLAIEAARLLPTPRASDTNGAGLHGEGGMDLRTAVTLLPTPRAQNGEERNAKAWERPLDQPQNLENALARVPTVARLIGASTPPPSTDGQPSSGDPPPTPPTTEDA